VIGHRGASAVAPENTLAAFRRAMEDGADGVELDVRLSRDGLPVVIHDATLRRTGLRAGTILEMPIDELGQVDVGSWFSRARPHLARAEFATERVPALDEVFQLFAAGGESFTNAKLYVELKTEHTGSSAVELTGAVVSSVLAHGLAQRVVVLAFDLRAIAEVRRVSSTVRTGALFKPHVTTPMGFIRKQELISRTLDSGASEIALHRSLATRGLVTAANKQGLSVVVWTVDNPKWMIRTRNWGVNAVITNNPAGLRTMTP
jgi:glycerophosphoryl diester phosphodiesterase